MKRITALAAPLLLALGMAVGTAPAAQADRDEYLNILRGFGFTINDTASTLSLGYRVCNRLEYSDPAAVTRWVFVSTPWGQTNNYEDAAEVVVAAIMGLCPWHAPGNGGVRA